MTCKIIIDNQEFNLQYILKESEVPFINYCKLSGTKIEGTDETIESLSANEYFKNRDYIPILEQTNKFLKDYE